MDAAFWIKAWEEGRTNFHQQQYNPKLLQYFPELKPQKGQEVLVPLCGKTKDMVWLEELGLKVHGIELYEKAIESFFVENKLAPVTREEVSHFNNYHYQNITLSCGDFFQLNESSRYDFIYDRAALVALPEEMRKQYAEVIQRSLKYGGKCLLITFDYDQSKMDGPPFSVNSQEVYRLYQDNFKITLMESSNISSEGGKLSSVGDVKQNVYIMEKH